MDYQTYEEKVIYQKIGSAPGLKKTHESIALEGIIAQQNTITDDGTSGGNAVFAPRHAFVYFDTNAWKYLKVSDLADLTALPSNIFGFVQDYNNKYSVTEQNVEQVKVKDSAHEKATIAQGAGTIKAMTIFKIFDDVTAFDFIEINDTDHSALFASDGFLNLRIETKDGSLIKYIELR